MGHTDTSSKNGRAGQDKVSKLHRFLQAVPYLTFSDTGLSNVAKRFDLTLEELQDEIRNYQPEREQDGK